jgi:hypothetical protein
MQADRRLDTDCADVAREVRAVAAAPSIADSVLRAAVARCAAAARRAGCPPEQFLVAIKQSLPDAGATDIERWIRAVTRRRVVTWAIEAYYAARVQ